MELTIDCKVIYGFYLVKSFTVCCFFCRRVQINLNRDLLWFGVFSERGFGKDILRGVGGLEVVFMVNSHTYGMTYVCKMHIFMYSKPRNTYDILTFRFVV